jgi:type II secretory ATPase GspE/PulE/Tfp pilus assembly ATPase PilB-like protein
MTEVTQILSKPQMSILQSTAGINLFLAGTGSGKTFLGGVLSINFITKFP